MNSTNLPAGAPTALIPSLRRCRRGLGRPDASSRLGTALTADALDLLNTEIVPAAVAAERVGGTDCGCATVTLWVEGGSLADLDGDGDMDYFEANIGTGGSHVWINQNLEPSVSLGVDTTSISEGGGPATITATLSAAHSQDVTVNLAFSGTAGATTA